MPTSQALTGADIGAMPVSASQPLGAMGQPVGEPWPGMTLRQHYAGIAMAALIAKVPLRARFHGDAPETLSNTNTAVAVGALHYADAMLEQLAKVQP